MNKSRIRIFIRRGSISTTHSPFAWEFNNNNIYEFLSELNYIKTIYA